MDKYEKFAFRRNIIFCFSVIYILAIVFSLTLFADASSSPSYDLPLTIGIPSNLSSTDITPEIVQQAVNDYLTILSSQYQFDGSDNYTCFVAGRDGKDLVLIVTYDLVCGHLPANDPNFSTDYENIYYNNNSMHYVTFNYDGDTQTLSSGTFSGGWVSTWSFNRSNFQYGIGWVLASVNDFPDYWIFPEEVTVPNVLGHSSQPNLDPDDIINGDGSNNPIERPNLPPPSSYSPTVFNPPSLDLTSIETLLESIWDILNYGFSYLKDNLSGWFSNLLSNLASWFGYLTDSIYYVSNRIVNTLNNLASFLYDNFVSLFEPISNALATIATFFNSLLELGKDENGNFSLTTFIVRLIVPDPEDLAESLILHDEFGFISLVGAVKTKVNSIYSSIFNLSSTKVFTIPSFTAFGITFPAYQMDFSWFDNFKVYSDTIISGFLIIGYFHWLFTSISTHIRGGSVIAGDVTVPDKKGGY